MRPRGGRFLEFRAGLARRMQQEWIGEMERLRRDEARTWIWC